MIAPEARERGTTKEKTMKPSRFGAWLRPLAAVITAVGLLAGGHAYADKINVAGIYKVCAY